MKKLSDIITDAPLADHHPKSWKTAIPHSKTVIFNYRNLAHFKNAMSVITQETDEKCDISYANALSELKADKGTIKEKDYQVIKAKVKAALLKKKLISDNIYTSFEYSVEGEVIDMARFCEGNPECAIVPKSTGKQYFYELYINSAIPHYVSDKDINDKLARILATIQLLESERIYIKLNAVTAGDGIGISGKRDFVNIIPIFSHKEFKTIDSMSAVINTRLFRKFSFATWEDYYGGSKNMDGGYGTQIDLPNCINLKDDFSEVEFAEEILDKFITPCKKKVKK